MQTRRTIRSGRTSNPFVPFEALEPRQLLATWFNPDGPTVATPAQTPSSMVTADFDGDHKADLVTAVGNDILFQKGGGGGRFGAPRLIAHLNSDAGLLAVGDFNADGLPDLFSVQQNVHQGWYRLIMNQGLGQLSIASYGRAWTAVESVTVGNIDSDAQDEVLLKGGGPLVATLPQSIWGEAPDEIRVLDPRPPFVFVGGNGAQLLATPIIVTPGGTFFPIPPIRFNDLGPAIYGNKLATPLIANLRGGATNDIVVGGQDVNTSTGFLQTYTFTPGSPLSTEGLPSSLFTPVGDRIIIAGVPTSIAAADMTQDSATDLVVSTLEYPALTVVPFTGSYGTFRARTFILPRFGPSDRLYFNSPSSVDDRLLNQGDLIARASEPDYRIGAVADLNSDGLMDVGISLTESVTLGGGSYTTTGSFIQAIRNPVEPIYLTSIVAQVSSPLSSFQTISHVQLFLAADVRHTGRPDLFVADAPSASPSRVRIFFNVNASLIQPL